MINDRSNGLEEIVRDLHLNSKMRALFIKRQDRVDIVDQAPLNRDMEEELTNGELEVSEEDIKQFAEIVATWDRNRSKEAAVQQDDSPEAELLADHNHLVEPLANDTYVNATDVLGG